MITTKQAVEMLREYDGMDLTKVGTLVEDRATYNYDLYQLPNGKLVELRFNEYDNSRDVYLFDGEDWVYAGICFDGNTYTATEKEYY